MTRVVGRGWATVDLDRAAGELAHLVGQDPGFAEAPRSQILGARCRRGRVRRDGQATVGADWIVLLEPDTEGWLAAFLARNGEGWAATWTAVGADGLGPAGRPGPFGPERPSGRPPSGEPFRLNVTTATIEP